jgi:hypothetical protein
MKKYLFELMILSSFVACTPDCSEDKSSYDDGYTHGKIATYDDSQSCSSYVEAMSNEGINLSGNSCFCEGFNDAKSGNENKYKKD